jgi:2'-5' RNA ligase
VRLFIAIPLPPDVASRAFSVLADMTGLRRVEPELMHLTLAFLGSTPDERLDLVVEAVRAGARARAAFEIVIDHAGRFPNSGSPRVAWLGISAGADDATALARTVREALAARSLSFDEKPFRAHVTLGRVREQATKEEARAIGAALDAVKMSPLRFPAEAVHVIESRVSSKGPRYTSRAQVALGAGCT